VELDLGWVEKFSVEGLGELGRPKVPIMARIVRLYYVKKGVLLSVFVAFWPLEAGS